MGAKKRQFCVNGHDTFLVGRDSSYRCLRCKAEASRAARVAREAEVATARRAEVRRQQAEYKRQQEAEARRRARERERILKAGGPEARKLKAREAFDRCSWPISDDDICGRKQALRPVGSPEPAGFCDIHKRGPNQSSEDWREAYRKVQIDPTAPPPRPRPKPKAAAPKPASPLKEPVRPDTGQTLTPEPDPPRLIPLPQWPFEGTWYPVE